MTEYKFTANYQLVEEQPIVISFDKLHKELYDRGWTVHWEFNGGTIDPLLKYNHCITVDDCVTVNSEYAYDVDGNGAWNYRLDNLENADEMFVVSRNEETNVPTGSPALVSFNADLPKVTTGYNMFAGCSNLTTFNGDLSNLSESMGMFGGCPKLTSFTSDLSNLTMSYFMFGSNYETVEKFIYDVLLGDVDISEIPPGAIETEIQMALQVIGAPTSLDIASVQNIADTINDISGITPPADLDEFDAASWGRIDIGIDPTLEGNSDIEAALTTISNKGWNVTPMYDFEIPYIPSEGLLKYNNCRSFIHCQTIDANVATDVDENGAWNYSLDNLETGGIYNEESGAGGGLFTLIGSSNPFNTSLKSFNVDLPKLTNGSAMFTFCTALTSFSSALPSLIYGKLMFAWAGLTSFSSALPNLTNGNMMFALCSNLTSFSSALPNLTNGEGMFAGCGFTSWTIDLPALTNGNTMFSRCEDLTSFSSALPNLTEGKLMFGYDTSSCTKLDLASVQNIADTINDLTGKTPDGTEGWGQISIGISSSIQGNADLATALAVIRSKGWTVEENYA